MWSPMCAFPHKGNVGAQVIEGAFTVLDGFDRVRERRDDMQAITLQPREAEVFAHAALAIKYDDPAKRAARQRNADSQAASARRRPTRPVDEVQPRAGNLTRGGLYDRAVSSRRQSTRPILSIDQNVKINRALWMLAEACRN